jgi:hypothetical protein
MHHSTLSIVLALFALPSSSLRCSVTTSNTALRRTASGARVVTQDGNLANAKYNASFVLFGMSYGDCVFEACANTSAGACGFNGRASRFLAYLSPSLADGSWSDPIELLPAAARPAAFDGAIFFRPHLVFNPNTRNWVLWVRWLPPDGPSLSDDPTYYFSASSPSLDEPFIVNQTIVPMFFNNSADDNLFVDPSTGAGYLIHTSRATNTKITVERLTDDFLSSRGALEPTQRSAEIGPGHTEAPAMWLDAARARYYVSFSPLCCYCTSGSPTQVWSAASALGPYAPAGALGNAPSAQQNWVLSDESLVGGVVWSGSRWGSDPAAGAGRPPIFDSSLQYWAPLAFDASGAALPLAWANESTFEVEVDAPACPGAAV